MYSGGFLNQTCSDAACANPYAFHSPALQHAHFLKVRLPYASGFPIGMAHIIAILNTLAADLTPSGHLMAPRAD